MGIFTLDKTKFFLAAIFFIFSTWTRNVLYGFCTMALRICEDGSAAISVPNSCKQACGQVEYDAMVREVFLENTVGEVKAIIISILVSYLLASFFVWGFRKLKGTSQVA